MCDLTLYYCFKRLHNNMFNEQTYMYVYFSSQDTVNFFPAYILQINVINICDVKVGRYTCKIVHEQQ